MCGATRSGPQRRSEGAWSGQSGYLSTQRVQREARLVLGEIGASGGDDALEKGIGHWRRLSGDDGGEGTGGGDQRLQCRQGLGAAQRVTRLLDAVG